MKRNYASVSAVLRAAAFLIPLAGVVAGHAQPTGTPGGAGVQGQLPLAQCHIFRVAYNDAELGQVFGTACVDWRRRHAEVRLVSPLNGAESVLSSISFTPPNANGEMEVVLTGESPNLQKVLAPSVDALPSFWNANQDEITVKSGVSEAKAQVRFPDVAENRVTVNLTAEEDNTLLGRWHYLANPITERAENGGGRVGAFSMPTDANAPFLGTQVGREEWTPLPTKIYFVAVLEDQTAQHYKAIYPYPAYKSEIRTLMIVGQNFPLLNGSDIHPCLEPLKTDQPKISYGDAGFLSMDPAWPDPAIERAWKEICEGLDADTAKAIRKLPVARVTVSLYNGVKSGATDFTWNGARGRWMLQFGDNTARIRMVRKLPGGDVWEATSTVFLPESLKIEVETAQELPLDSIEVHVANNGTFLPEPLTANRIGGPKSHIYRTDPIAVTGPDQSSLPGAIPAKAGDKITLIVDQKNGIFYGAVQADVDVVASQLALSATWNHALTICAALDGKPDILDWDHLPGQQAQALTSIFVFATSQHTVKCDISLGQHAAMLMLRDLFVELMKRQRDNLQLALGNDEAVLGFGKTVAQALRQDPLYTSQANSKSVFYDLPAGELNSEAVTLKDAVNDENLRRVFGANVEEERKWKISAFRAGLKAYIATIQKSIDAADAIRPRDFKELLALTGKGFEPIVAQLLPRMMRKNLTSGVWEPDLVARGYISSVGPKEQEFIEEREAANIDTQLFVGVLGAATALPVMFSESAFASFVTWAGNGVMWGAQSVEEVYDVYEAKKEIGFAQGASVVLGNLRYEEAKLRDSEWWSVALSIAAQGALANLQGYDALTKFSREAAVLRGLQTLEELNGGIQGLRNLSKVQLGEVEAAALKAKALAVAGKEVDPRLQRAIAIWDSYANELKGGEAAVAADFQKTVRLRQALAPQEQQAVLTPATVAAADVDAAGKEAARLAAARQENLVSAVKELSAEVSKLKVAETAAIEGPARQAIAGQIKANAARAAIISDMLEAGRADATYLQTISDAEVAWITGIQKEVNVGRMKSLLAQREGSWTAVKSALKEGKISTSDMHQFVTWRKQEVDQLVDAVMADVKKEMSELLGYDVQLKRKAFGSTNLTSDYDISIEGPGAERVVARFNERFRAAYRDAESAFVFDTNVYTDPVYNLFKARAMFAGKLELGAVEMDTVRQFSYDQMAMRKYVPDEVWNVHKQLLRASSQPEAREMLEFGFAQAEKNNEAAKKLIAAYKGAATGDNAAFKAANQAYAEVLGTVDSWRLEMTRLDGLFAKDAHFQTLPSPKFLEKYPEYRKKLDAMAALLRDDKLQEAEALRSAMAGEAIAQLRNEQGLALYFASEAYQSEGTIAHVVVELQGDAKRAVTLDSLLETSKRTNVDALAYLNSFNENRANMFKEFNHLGLFGGKEAAGEELAAKAAKYFIRQLDAMRQAGYDLNELVGKDLVAMTLQVDSVRGETKNVVTALENFGLTAEQLKQGAKSGMTGKQFVDQVRQASDKLAAAGVTNRQFTYLAAYLENDLKELKRLEGLASVK